MTDKTTWVAFGVEPILGVNDPHITIGFFGEATDPYVPVDFNSTLMGLKDLARSLWVSLEKKQFEVMILGRRTFSQGTQVYEVGLPRNVLEVTNMFRTACFTKSFPLSMRYYFNPHVTVGNVAIPPTTRKWQITNLFVQDPLGRYTLDLGE